MIGIAVVVASAAVVAVVAAVVVDVVAIVVGSVTEIKVVETVKEAAEAMTVDDVTVTEAVVVVIEVTNVACDVEVGCGGGDHVKDGKCKAGTDREDQMFETFEDKYPQGR